MTEKPDYDLEERTATFGGAIVGFEKTQRSDTTSSSPSFANNQQLRH